MRSAKHPGAVRRRLQSTLTQPRGGVPVGRLKPDLVIVLEAGLVVELKATSRSSPRRLASTLRCSLSPAGSHQCVTTDAAAFGTNPIGLRTRRMAPDPCRRGRSQASASPNHVGNISSGVIPVIFM